MLVKGVRRSAADDQFAMGPIDPNDERTRIGGANAGHALPIGFALQEFVIEGLLGEGGFGIVYLARDTRLQRQVALKEYMPSTLAVRAADLSVCPRSQWQREMFATGLRSFVNEAQLLASFDHPSLVKVYRFWEENGTAYMVMPMYRGPTLKQWLRDSGTRPGQQWLLSLLLPLTDALEQLHNADPCCLHRDVAPDNVLLLDGSDSAAAPTPARPLLLDFGAARRVIGDMTKTLTVFLKPGYAPVEQYGDVLLAKQGPWTDVYALSAVMYACVTGRAPVASVDRILADDMVPAARAGAGRYSPRFLAAIDAGLMVRPEDRPQSMREFRQLFAGSPHARLLADPLGDTTSAWPALDPAQPQTNGRSGPPPAPAAIPGKARGNGLGWPGAVFIADGKPTRAAWAAVASTVVAASLGLWWALKADTSPAAPTRASGLASSKGRVEADNARAPVAPAATAASAPWVAPAGPAPFSVLAVLQDIVERSDPQIRVTATVDKTSLVIGKDALRFRVKSNEAGYVYVFFGGTDKSHFHLLFPNRLDRLNRIEPGAEMVLPRKGWEITAEGPVGTNHLVVLVSPQERDLANVGLRQTEAPIPEFELVQAERLWRQRPQGLNPFVGEPVCTTPGCSGAFGATMLTVNEVAAAGRSRN
jgi:serine/threonine protein kinase